MNLASTITSGAKPIDAPARPQLGEVMFNKFSELIYEISGIRFQFNKAYFLSSKLLNRCNALGIDTFEAYYSYIMGASGRTEYGYLLDEITINETFFFRHQPQLDAFEKEILMPLVYMKKSHRQNKIRIWSCAASTGDEAYTTALMIKNLNLDDEFEFDIVGTDICHDALQKARAGVYKQYAVRNIPQNLLQKYFTQDPIANTYGLSDEIKKMVHFQEANLMDATRLAALGKFDIAFCRNVLIYFDEASKEKVLMNIYNAIADDGTLLLGHSENIYSQRHIFKQDKQRTAAIAYTKQPPGTPKHTV
ncbi:MAG: protein-glutamate O-methyltransferase CheR [Alphaproteobacteria bacterium]|nr:protein-glutamate O-methyltransferase CheR [Alphaproteobacteria bacterium]